MMFFYVLDESVIIRQTHPRRPELEIYRGHGQWDPYFELQHWKANAQRITEATAGKLLARYDAIAVGN